MKTETLKQLREFGDLYGFDIIHFILKNIGYTHYQMTRNGKSIPKVGSPCYNLSKFNKPKNLAVSKVILHKDNSVTLKVNDLYIKYIKL